MFFHKTCSDFAYVYKSIYNFYSLPIWVYDSLLNFIYTSKLYFFAAIELFLDVFLLYIAVLSFILSTFYKIHTHTYFILQNKKWLDFNWVGFLHVKSFLYSIRCNLNYECTCSYKYLYSQFFLLYTHQLMMFIILLLYTYTLCTNTWKEKNLSKITSPFYFILFGFFIK